MGGGRGGGGVAGGGGGGGGGANPAGNYGTIFMASWASELQTFTSETTLLQQQLKI